MVQGILFLYQSQLICFKFCLGIFHFLGITEVTKVLQVLFTQSKMYFGGVYPYLILKGQ